MTDTEAAALPVLLGPTAVGKTSIACELAISINAEIVCCDSRQVYRFMDIGTAKPTKKEKALVPHHLIDVVNPDDTYNASRYAQDAARAIDRIRAQGKVPLLVVGTGLYLRALLEGLFDGPGSDHEIRRRLLQEERDGGTGTLHRRLAIVDPEAAARIPSGNLVRVIRALEVWEITGRPISEWQKDHVASRQVKPAILVGLRRPREVLYRRIEERADAMLEAGWLDEVRTLLKEGYHPPLPSLGSLGYRDLVAYLQEQVSWEEAVNNIKRDTRRYAKRQLTWFRAIRGLRWVDLGEGNDWSSFAAILKDEFEGAG